MADRPDRDARLLLLLALMSRDIDDPSLLSFAYRWFRRARPRDRDIERLIDADLFPEFRSYYGGRGYGLTDFADAVAHRFQRQLDEQIARRIPSVIEQRISDVTEQRMSEIAGQKISEFTSRAESRISEIVDRRASEITQQGISSIVEKRIADAIVRVRSVERTQGHFVNELQSVEAKQDQIQSEIGKFQIEQVVVKSSVHDLIWQITTGINFDEAKVVRYVPVRIYFSDPVLESAHRETTVAAIERIVQPFGLERTYELPDETGSWWKKFVLRTKEALTHHELQKEFEAIEKALKANYLDKPQAEANKLQAAATAELISSLNQTANACIQVGTLLLVKITKPDGQCAVAARTLTSAELKHLEENQAILKQPEIALELLQGFSKTPALS